MSVLLPETVGPASADPYFIDSGGVQRSLASGEDMRLDRLGDRFGLVVNLPPLRWHVADPAKAARVWTTRLVQGMSQGAVLLFPQPNFAPPGGTMAAAGAAVSGSSQVLVANGGAAAALLEGQFMTHVRAATGRRYCYQVRADTIVPAGGQAVVPFWPRVRGPIAPGDVLKFGKPEIEGLVRGEQQGWTLDNARLVGIVFKIEERG